MARPSRPLAPALLVVLALPGLAAGQAGDRPGEEQPALRSDVDVPAAPVLAPARALESFVIDDRFVVELVAAEPLVEDPVQIAWSADGRMWVCEMRGFMPDVDGTGETLPVGRISVLDDTDGDGVMDVSTPFVEHLVLPRALAPSHGGLLVVAPPDLLFYRDLHGDPRADEMLLLHSGFAGIDSPEHAGNGLLYGHDNRFWLSQHPLRFRFDGEDVVVERTPGHGQWGIAKDDAGRIYTTTNSDPLRVDLVSSHYAVRHPDLRALAGVDERASTDFETWPVRVTPGVNRGYQPGILREDHTLARVTAACGPALERSGRFPKDARGNAFVAEPAANLVKRVVLTEDADGTISGRNAYEGRDFLASTDERFRPVHLSTGPDGGLYVVDFYRGVIQHRVFLTTWLRRQIVARGLEKPVGRGRIWRVRPRGTALESRPALHRATDAELVLALAHRNGWWRDTAQRLLVERRASGATEALRALLRHGPSPVARLHALWTLDGIGHASPSDVEAAAADADPAVRAAALRVGEPYLADDDTFALACALLDDVSPAVRLQAILTLGERRDAAGLARLVRVLVERPEDDRARSAVLSGVYGREIELLDALVAEDAFAPESEARSAALDALVELLLRSRDGERLAVMLERATAVGDERIWIGNALLAALARRLGAGSERPRSLALARPPLGWDALRGRGDALGAEVRRLDPLVTWPGRPGHAPARGPEALSEADRSRFELGERLYGLVCASCHRADGRGAPGSAPPLASSARVLGDDARLARILLHGMTGDVERDGHVVSGDMPPAAAPGDGQIAAILTYVRLAFGNDAPPVSPERIRAVRAATAGRDRPWTARELDALPPERED